jgi:tRNA modification GTPase
LEAGLDFVEEDIEFVTAERLDCRLGEAAESISRLVRQMSSRHVAGGEFRVALIGCPNVGKSSLLNALAADQVALVSRRAGTTRDYLICRIDLEGVPCEIIDTAGLDQSGATAKPLESLSQEMTAAQQRDAHLQLLCLDSTRPLNAWEQAQLPCHSDSRCLLVLTKTDGPRSVELLEPAIETSSRTGAGLEQLREAIRQRFGSPSLESSVVAETVVRCRDSLRRVERCIRRARKLAITEAGEELVAAELRVALDELGRVVGAVYTDDILDRVFSRFCIGK